MNEEYKLQSDYKMLEIKKQEATQELENLKTFLKSKPLVVLKNSYLGIYLKPKITNDGKAIFVLDIRKINYADGLEILIEDTDDMLFALNQIKDIKEMNTHELLNYYQKKQVLEKI